MNKKKKYLTDIDEFEYEANERFDNFCFNLVGDDRFTIEFSALGPNHEYQTEEGEGWSFVYTSAGSRLVRSFKSRLNKLAVNLFGFDEALGITIQSSYYREL